MAEIKFGTDGWRGIIAEDFTFKNVRIVTQAIANYLKSQSPAAAPSSAAGGLWRVGDRRQRPSVVVGYDTRFLSAEFAKACVQVLRANKTKVYFLKKPLPTPVTAYTIKVYKASGAIMITASHNPSHYNGIKFIPEYAGPATSEITKAIERNIVQVTSYQLPVTSQKTNNLKTKKPELVKEVDPTKRYVHHLKKLVDFKTIRKSKLKVIVDPMYGAALDLMPFLLEEAGLKVKTIHNLSNPLFGGALPDPNSINLKKLAKKVLEEKADLGLALDGDGDRFGVVDNQGRYFSPNEILPIVAFHLLKNRGFKGAIVRSVATTHLLDKIAAAYGNEVIETPVGFKHLGQIMLKKPVTLAGEESGGLSILGHIPEKDGLLANLLVVEALTYEKKSLKSILRDLTRKFGSYVSQRLDIEISNEEKEKLLKSLKANPPDAIDNLKLKKVILTDGFKLLLAGGSWLLIRPSGTEPLIRIYIESTSQSGLKTLENFVLKLLKI